MIVPLIVKQALHCQGFHSFKRAVDEIHVGPVSQRFVELDLKPFAEGEGGDGIERIVVVEDFVHHFPVELLRRVRLWKSELLVRPFVAP